MTCSIKEPHALAVLEIIHPEAVRSRACPQRNRLAAVTEHNAVLAHRPQHRQSSLRAYHVLEVLQVLRCIIKRDCEKLIVASHRVDGDASVTLELKQTLSITITEKAKRDPAFGRAIRLQS
jgi:hypothetical protein